MIITSCAYCTHMELQRSPHTPDDSSADTVCDSHRGTVTILCPDYTRDWFFFRFEVMIDIIRKYRKSQLGKWNFIVLCLFYVLCIVKLTLRLFFEYCHFIAYPFLFHFMYIRVKTRREHKNKFKTLLYG